MTPNPVAKSVIARSDRGEPVATIAKREKMPLGRAYAILRRYRPDRERKAREPTSVLRPKVLALLALRPRPTVARVAKVLRISRAYVYRIIAES